MTKTQILAVDPLNPEASLIDEAADVVRRGGLVAFPTETVYGLGADAFNPRAVARIFEAKERPLDDPLIVHVASEESLVSLGLGVSEVAFKLAEAFWPGPLTLVLQKTDQVPDIVTAGLDSVAVRMPDNLVAFMLIRASESPIAAPSANLFGRPSPTKADHVLHDLDNRIDLILDGGPTKIGVESTVLDLTGPTAKLLRPGAVTLEQLREVLPVSEEAPAGVRVSPGMFPSHYSPRAQVFVIETGSELCERAMAVAEKLRQQGRAVGIMSSEETRSCYPGFLVKSYGARDDLETVAARLFSILRDFDAEGIEAIVAEGVDDKGLGLAIMDRLRKASGPKK